MTEHSLVALSSLLLLSDSRLPAGGHAHSGGIEVAVARGDIATISDLETFIVGRLGTTGYTSAAFAAATTILWDARSHDMRMSQLQLLEQELDARTPSAVQRRVSRSQGRALLRVVIASWPSEASELDLSLAPHLATATGLACAVAHLAPTDAAVLTCQSMVTGAASAAVRLLGLDPVAVTAMQARLASSVGLISRQAAAAAASCDSNFAALPSNGSPLLDIRAEFHATQEVRLFAS
jgi:urease accessory protein